MNEGLERQVARIREAVGRLDRLLESKGELIARQQAEREDHVKESWHLRRDLAAVEHARNDYDAVTDENRRLKEREGRLASELRDLRAKIKALSEYLHQ